MTHTRYNESDFKFETTPLKLKKDILDQYETAKDKKSKDDFDKMFIKTVKEKLKQVRLKLIVTHLPSKISHSWVIETDLDQVDRSKYITDILTIVSTTRENRKRTIQKQQKSFDGAHYELVGGVFLGPVDGNRINNIGKNCTTNDPFMAKLPRKPKANYVGIELEFNPAPNQSTKTIAKALKDAGLSRYVQVGEDGSCGGMDSNGQRLRGFEVRVLLEEINFLENLSKICKVLKDLGFKTDTTCGTHVHIDMRNRDVKKCYENLFKVQTLLRKFLTKDRKKNIFCMKNDYANYDEHVANAVGREARRCGINTQSYSKYKTLEIRMHQGTLDAEKLAPFINLLVKIANYGGNINKTVHTLKQAKAVLNVDEPLFNNLKERLTSRGA